MNSRLPTLIRLPALALISLLAGPVAFARDAELKFPDLGPFERAATDSVNITVGPWMLHTASALLDDSDPDTAATKKLLAGIKSVRVRSFEFAADFNYPQQAIDAIQRQLAAPGWTPLVQTRDRKHGEHLDIYLSVEDDKTNGFILVDAEPRQFTVINIVGSIRLEDLPAIEQHLHIPKTGPSAAAAF